MYFIKKEKTMASFQNVNIEKKANIYFDGKVISRNVIFTDGSIKTLGIMLPGEYEFNTVSRELMEITSGKLEYQLLNETAWKIVTEGMSFCVQKNSSFKVKVFEVVNYCCSYSD